MLFGDAPRMSDVTLAAHGNITVARKHATTENHLGPGAYFTVHNENIRGGWIKRSFSTRQPMGPTTRKYDRGSSYTTGVVQDNMYYEQGSSFNTPGPGAYHQTEMQPSLYRNGGGGVFNPQVARMVNRKGGMGSTSPRMLNLQSTVRNGLLYHGSQDEGHIGPGHYYDSEKADTLTKKSFNVRVGDGNSPQKLRRRGSSPRAYSNQQPNYYSNYDSNASRYSNASNYDPRVEQAHDMYAAYQYGEMYGGNISPINRNAPQDRQSFAEQRLGEHDEDMPQEYRDDYAGQEEYQGYN